MEKFTYYVTKIKIINMKLAQFLCIIYTIKV